MVAQDRIEVGFGDPQPPFGAVRRARIGRRRWPGGRSGRFRSRPCARQKGSCADSRSGSPIRSACGRRCPSGAGVRRCACCEIGGGKVHRAVGLLDDQAANATIGQLDGEGQSNRAGAGDENGCVFLVHWFAGQYSPRRARRARRSEINIPKTSCPSCLRGEHDFAYLVFFAEDNASD